MNEAFVKGFMSKCAEAGVDPEELMKAAQGGLLGTIGRAVTGGLSKGLSGAGSQLSKVSPNLGGRLSGYGGALHGKNLAYDLTKDLAPQAASTLRNQQLMRRTGLGTLGLGGYGAYNMAGGGEQGMDPRQAQYMQQQQILADYMDQLNRANEQEALYRLYN